MCFIHNVVFHIKKKNDIMLFHQQKMIENEEKNSKYHKNVSGES